MTVERDLPAVMTDGVTLLADRWVPGPGGRLPGATAGPAPIVLLRSPYGRRQIGVVGRLFAERGYQAVIQSCRGTFGSGGEWEPFRHEQDDGRDTLRWLATQPWFGGAVMTFGPSYLGLVQWAVCDQAPDWLLATAPAVTSAFFRDAVVYPGDAFAFETTVNWMYQLEHQERGVPGLVLARLRGRRRAAAGHASLPLADADRAVVGRRVAFYQDWLAHDRPGDPWWDPVDFRGARPQSPPATLQAGWYDIFLPEQLDDFTALRAAGRPARITVGPWIHGSPGGIAASLRDSLAWFDRHRPGGGTGPQAPAVRLFVQGRRRWVDLPHWPPPATTQRWHLHGGGRLDPAAPADTTADRFRYDPADPTPSAGGASLDARSAGRKDQRTREARPDVLVYTGPVLDDDVTVAGPVTADLFVRSSVDHFDVFVRLCVVTAKGRSFNVSDGIIRLAPGSAPPADGDGVRRVRVRMWPTATTFRRGERVRLQVSAGAHPLYARNPGSGEPLGRARTFIAADLEVFHDSGRPSAVELPVAKL